MSVLRGVAVPSTPRCGVPLVSLTVLAAVALAVLSWATLPTIPSYDPYSWIIWGRELSDPHLAFAVFDGPSWKPLPFAFTAVYGLFGGAAPTLWMITARAAGLLGLVAAWRLAARLGGASPGAGDGPGSPWPGRVAGLLAVLAVILTYDWPYDMLRGTSEPMLVAGTLWPIERWLAGRRRAPFWLLVGLALLRPEAWPFLIALTGRLARSRDRERGPGRLELLAGLTLIPVGWFGPPWLASGAPLLAAHNARAFDGVLGGDPLWTELGRLVGEQTWPLLVAAGGLVALGPGARQDRRLVAGLAAGVLAWWAIVVVETVVFGYPGLERFFLPAAAVVCVLGAAGIVRLGVVAAQSLGRRSGAGVPRWAGAVAVAALTAAAAVGTLRPISVLGAYLPEASLAVRTVDGMDRTVRSLGGRRVLLPCAVSFVAVNHAAQPALAWELRVGLPSVGTAMSRPGVDLIGPANRATGVPAALAPALVRERALGQVGHWSAYVLARTPAGLTDHCAGR